MGVDYPRTLLELERRFATEAGCRAYLQQLRWPEGFACPRCGGDAAWSASRGRLVCCACRHQTSATAGTIFHDVRKPLVLWFRAVWCVTSQKSGASAAHLQQVLGLGSYQTAWTWLHKLRRAMVRPGRDQLRGTVEVDETFVGGEDSQGGAWRDKKALVVVAAEENGRGIGRIRLAAVSDKTRASLGRFVKEAVASGSIVHTDGGGGYGGLDKLGYRHRPTPVGWRSDQARAGELLPRVHRVASLLKRWLLGTHQGAVSVEHLDYYLDEFTFRFNRRTSRSRGKLFYRLLENAVQLPPAPYRDIIGGKPAPQ